MKPDQQRMTTLLADSILALCKDGLQYKQKFSVRGLLGITLDDEEVFLVDIHEKLGQNAEKVDKSDANVGESGSMVQESTKVVPPVSLVLRESDSVDHVDDDSIIQHIETVKSPGISHRKKSRKRSGSGESETVHGRESEQAYMSYKMRTSSGDSTSTSGHQDQSDLTGPSRSKERKIQREAGVNLSDSGRGKHRKSVEDAECDLEMDVVDELSSDHTEGGGASTRSPATVGHSERTSSNTETDSPITDSILHRVRIKMEHTDDMAISETMHLPVKQELLHASDIFHSFGSPEMIPVMSIQPTGEPLAGCSNWESQGPIQNADVNMQTLFQHNEMQMPLEGGNMSTHNCSPASERQKAFRSRVRADPERYAEFKLRDNWRHRNARKHWTPEQREKERERCRIRKRKYRAKKKAAESQINSSADRNS